MSDVVDSNEGREESWISLLILFILTRTSFSECLCQMQQMLVIRLVLITVTARGADMCFHNNLRMNEFPEISAAHRIITIGGSKNLEEECIRVT